MRLPQLRDHLGGHETATAKIKEVVRQPVGGRADDLPPQLPHAGLGGVEVDPGAGLGRATARERPGQSVTVDLAARARWQARHRCKPRHQGGGHRRPQRSGRRGRVKCRVGGEVADENLGSTRGRPHGGGRCRNPRQGEECRVDFAELDPAATDLDLVVGPPQEAQSVGVVDDEVARAVGALPTEAGHRGIPGGVLDGVEVAGEADAADDELAALPEGDFVTLSVDNGEVPAVEGEPDPHRTRCRHLRATGDDGGLGRAVRVPHLATRRDESRVEFRRQGLPTEDDEPHLRQRVEGPQRDEGGDGRDDGDPVRGQPRGQVHPGAHQRARRRDEARAVAPGQPHFFAARVEGDRQSGHHPVTRAQGCLLDKQSRLRVDECRRVAMGDGHSLGLARRSGREDHPGIVARRRARVGRSGVRQARVERSCGRGSSGGGSSGGGSSGGGSSGGGSSGGAGGGGGNGG